MADVHTPERRSYNMSRIKGRDTKPEITVRKLAHRLGYRFRLHRKNLPGKPDIVFPKLKKVILVHGCFWHMHDCHEGRVVVKERAEFWRNKRQGNADRDIRNFQAMKEQGWETLVIWECWIKRWSQDQLVTTISDFLGACKNQKAGSGPAIS